MFFSLYKKLFRHLSPRKWIQLIYVNVGVITEEMFSLLKPSSATSIFMGWLWGALGDGSFSKSATIN